MPLLPLPVLCLFYTVVGYLSGNVMYAYWLPKVLRGVDVRDYGADHNPGAANATVACGLPMGILCAVMDILKGTVAVALGAMWWDSWSGGILLPVALAPVCGHAWPVFWHGAGRQGDCRQLRRADRLLPDLLLAPLWGRAAAGVSAVHQAAPAADPGDERGDGGAELPALSDGLRAAIASGVAGILIIKHRRPPRRIDAVAKGDAEEAV